MGTRVTANFEVTSWEQSVYEEPEEGPSLLRGTVNKIFIGEVNSASHFGRAGELPLRGARECARIWANSQRG